MSSRCHIPTEQYDVMYSIVNWNIPIPGEPVDKAKRPSEGTLLKLLQVKYQNGHLEIK
jgi:hypothetical protein